MTHIGKLVAVAAASICLTAPAIAASETRPIHVACDNQALLPVCSALAQALRDLQPRDVAVINAPVARHVAALTLHYTASRNHADAVAGHLVWMDRNGHAGQGPTVELSVTDASVSEDLLAVYAEQLIRLSALPL